MTSWSMGSQFASYVGAQLVGLSVQLAFLDVLVGAGLDPLWGNAFAIADVVVRNFLVVRRFVFTPQQ